MKMKRVPGTSSTLLILTISVLWAQAAAAQPGPRKGVAPVDYSGNYQYAESLDHGHELVNQTIQELIDNLSPVFRRTLRKAASTRDFLVRNIRIDVTGEEITYRAVAYKAMTVRSEPNIPHIITSKSGRETKVIQRFRGEHFEQLIVNEYGEMHNVYTLVDDGLRLTVESTMSSKLLRNPVTIRLEYQRVLPPEPAKIPSRPGNQRIRNKQPRPLPGTIARRPRSIVPPATKLQRQRNRENAARIQHIRRPQSVEITQPRASEQPEPADRKWEGHP
jgi:hypothetical protein